MPVSIKDVARKAGVSSATVSRVLANKPHVTEAVRARVMAAVEALDYRPDRAARRLRSHTNDILGLVVSDVQNSFFMSVVRGVEDAAYRRQMNVVLCNTDENPDKQRIYLDLMRAERVAGVIVSPTRASQDGAVLQKMREDGIAVVLLERLVEGYNFDAVRVDNYHGAYTAVSHLIRNGRRRIAVINGLLNYAVGRDRFQGFSDALGAAGLPLDEALVQMGDFSKDSGYFTMRSLLAVHPRPDAVFIANDTMTLGAMQALREAGAHVPDDVAVIGFDETPWSAELYAPLTTVVQPTREMGQEAMRLMLRRLDDPDAPNVTTTLHTRLCIRVSCGVDRASAVAADRLTG